MLERISIRNFKSLGEVRDLTLPRLAVLFGPNAAGKSNVLDAIQALSRIGTHRTLSDALQEPIRGYPIEAFSFPPGGLSALLSQKTSSFELDAVLRIEKDAFEYRVRVRIDAESGSLAVDDEYLALLTTAGTPRGSALIQGMDGELHIRRKSKPAHPRHEPRGLNHSLLSDPRLGGLEYRGMERCRNELLRWRTYYLDPRVAMRRAAPPAEVNDIGVLGDNIAPFLYRLRAERPKEFGAVVRTLRTLIPSVEDLAVDLDKRRGTLDIVVRQNNVEYSSRIISEGTLRVLALCAIAVNPWGGSLVAFEEPENGVHPRRLELIADLLVALALEQDRQVVVTTHSPLFCSAIFKRQREHPGDLGLYRVSQGPSGTEVRRFDIPGPLFEDTEILESTEFPPIS
ncbi:MAG: AAA family ATPase [Acidobacteriota bacterium]